MACLVCTSAVKIGVIQFAPKYDASRGIPSKASAVALMLENLNELEKLGQSAVSNGAQVVLFPEDALYGFLNCRRDQMFPYLEDIPSTVGVKACGNASFAYAPVFQEASCMARRLKAVLVVDMGDVKPCAAAAVAGQPCPSDGRRQFNTQVAFFSDGSLAATYHKSHLYFEPQFNAPTLPDPTFFAVPAMGGVVFGLGVCFDLMYREPLAEVALAANASAILLSSWWVNTPPTATALQLYQARARKLGTALAVSGGVMQPGWLFSGVGVWTGDGEPLVQHSTVTNATDSVVLVADVPARGTAAGFAPRTSRPGATDQRLRARGLPLPRAAHELAVRGVSAHDVAARKGPNNPWHARAALAALHCNATTHYAPVEPSLPDRQQWAFRAAEVVVGGVGVTLVSSSGGLGCVGGFSPPAATAALPNGTVLGVLGVLAYEGSFSGLYEEQFCALSVCTSLTDCATPLLDPALPLAGASIAGNFTESYDPWFLAATTDGFTLPADKLVAGERAGWRWWETSLAWASGSLLNLAILAKPLAT